jgi:Leucine-rich repeat (LRR) protein
MTMTQERDSTARIYLAGTGTATIDWGDGTPAQTYELAAFVEEKDHGDHPYIIHAYTNTSVHTITVTGENITHIDCRRNRLTGLDVSKNTALKELCCYSNRLTVLDVSKNTALKYLNCNYNQLSILDVSKNAALTGLYCWNNQLTVLDVSKNTALTELNCSDNQLTALDISKNTALAKLYCDNNQLSGLDAGKNTALTLLNCEMNKLDAAALNALFGTLHSIEMKVKGETVNKTVKINNNPGTNACDPSIFISKGWSFR